MSALAMLNDETSTAAAHALAGRMLRGGGATTETRLAFGYELLLCEPPSAPTLQALKTVYDEARAKLPEDRALAVAATVLLNLDAVGMHQ